MNEQKDAHLLRELGLKLANFRKKLALAIGQKKITQLAFGEMFGHQTKRKITSYENGEVDPPASMLYLIWRSGNSLDGIFSEQPISEAGSRGAKELFRKLASEESKQMDEEALDRAIQEAEHVKAGKTASPTESSTKHSAQTKERHSKARSTKKR